MMSGLSDYLPKFGRNKNTQAREYHGLRNQGSTCYLNSVLQVLFMTEDFREAVGRCPNRCEDPIDHQLNTLFENLKERTGETYEVTKKLGIDKVNEQRDAGEYLEKILTQASEEASKIFDVQLIHRTICMGCEEAMDEEKSFWNLPLPLKNSSDENYSVMEAIQEFFKDSHFIEDNQLYCEKCQGKRDATIKCLVNRHPEVLMLLLKRFEFNYNQMRYVKNSRVVDVPCTIQIPQNQKYELYAFVEHFGSLKSGHYTSTIKSQDEDRWYDFNDSSVRELNNPPFQGNKIERSQSAYLLFYRKKGTDRDNRKVSHKGYLPDNNKNSRCRPDAFQSEKGEEDAGRNIMSKINNPNDTVIERSSDLCNKTFFDKGHTTQHQPSIDHDNTKEINHSKIAMSESQNKNGAKKPFYDENRVGGQGEPDNQVKTSENEYSLPKRRKTCENADQDGKEGPTGRKSDEKVERNRENILQEDETLNNGKQPLLEQAKHEQRKSFAEPVSYQTNSQVESSGAMQKNVVQKGALRAEVHRDRNKQVNNHSQIEEKADLKPNQHDIVAREDQKNSSDNPQKNRRDKSLNQEIHSIKKQGKADEYNQIVNTPLKSDELEEKQGVDSNKKGTKSKRSFRDLFGLKRNKSKNGQLKAKNRSVEESSESNRKGDKKGIESRQVDNTKRGDAKKGKKKHSLNCFGKK